MDTSLPLFIKGGAPHVFGVPTTLTKSAPLYVAGPIFVCEAMNLYLEASPAPVPGETLPLVVVGMDHNGAFSAMPLFIEGEPMGAVLNLFVSGYDAGTTSGVLNLFVGGGNASVVGSLPLFLMNAGLAIDGDLPLFVRGDGSNPGFFPVEASLNLHVERGPSAGLPLAVCNNNVASSLPLYVLGAPAVTASLPLFVLGPGGDLDGSLPLFVVGDSGTSIENSVELAIPVTHDIRDESLPLYVHGYQ